MRNRYKISGEYCLGILQNRTPGRIGEENNLHASVLIPLIREEDGSISVLFQVRSSKLPEQPGDICFPGGMSEDCETHQETALRETCEELLISPDTIELLGPSDYLQSGRLQVHPYVGWLHGYGYTYSKDEVKEVFTVPLQWLLDHEPECHEMEWKPSLPETFPFDKIYGGRKYAWRERKSTVFFYEYQGHVIWGMTAKMLEAWIRIIKGENTR
ncbi:MAG: CoA pyrophosphatase [Lachnospiraceae bacterium]|nr:CoA pyrophosphatase [Lachnospiraceae bacterium]